MDDSFYYRDSHIDINRHYVENQTTLVAYVHLVLFPLAPKTELLHYSILFLISLKLFL
jgi:hypothetical protein